MATAFMGKDIKLLNDAVRRAHNFPDRGLLAHPPEYPSFRIVGFADVTLANNTDFSTEL